MKKVFILFCLITLLGGVIFFFTLDFEGQEEVIRGSNESETTEELGGNTGNTDSNSLKVKKTNIEKEDKEAKETEVEKPKDGEVKGLEDPKRTISEFELDPQYYPSLGGYLKVDGKDIQALEIFFRKTESFVISLSFTKVTNSIFQVENSFWNLHRNSDGKSYNVRVGNGPLSGNIVTFTAKSESDDVDNEQTEDESLPTDNAEPADQTSYDDESQNNDQYEPSSNEGYDDGATENSAFE